MAVPVVAVIAAIDAAKEIAAGIEKVAGATDGVRSVVLIVENTLAVPLERKHDTHQSGGYAVTPSGVIPPRSVAVFSARSLGVAVGVDGDQTWEIRDKESENSILEIKWTNPFVGNNNADAYAWANGGTSPHKASALYRASRVFGIGDKHVQMRYTLLRRT
jgi:hypothetical protein